MNFLLGSTTVDPYQCPCPVPTALGDGTEEGKATRNIYRTQCLQQGGGSYESTKPVDDDYDMSVAGTH